MTRLDEPDIAPTLEQRVNIALREREETVAVAESATGGLVSSRITDVPGASEYFDRGVVAYSNEAKLELLGVDREALDDHGAVSEPVARQMARGVRDTADATWGLATTGIAGPSGGTEEKPVGTVFVGVAYAGAWGSGESYAVVDRHEFDGDREECKARFAARALRDLLRRTEDA